MFHKNLKDWGMHFTVYGWFLHSKTVCRLSSQIAFIMVFLYVINIESTAFQPSHIFFNKMSYPNTLSPYKIKPALSTRLFIIREWGGGGGKVDSFNCIIQLFRRNSRCIFGFLVLFNQTPLSNLTVLFFYINKTRSGFRIRSQEELYASHGFMFRFNFVLRKSSYITKHVA
jgi:hypothetical protein